MYQQTDSDKLQQSIRNPFAFYFAIKKGDQWVNTDATHAISSRNRRAWLPKCARDTWLQNLHHPTRT